MNRKARAALAEQTVEITEQGSYVSAGGKSVDLSVPLARCLDRTHLWTPDELAAMKLEVLAQPPRYPATAIEVRNETTLAGCLRMLASGATHLAALNFASARNPGGGFLSGSQAQEESLARSSALHASQQRVFSFYEFHRQHESLLYSDRIIFSPRCPVFRDDAGELLEAHYEVSFLTCAAPNAGALEQQGSPEVAELPETFRRRSEGVLAVAAHEGVEGLVLGAWGCGVFRNDPRTVAESFAAWLLPGRPYHGRFQTVIFSVLDFSEDLATLRAFEAALSMA